MWLSTFLLCGPMLWRKLHLFYCAVCAWQARASFKIMLRRWGGRAPGKRKAGEAKDDIQSSSSQLTAYPLVSGVDHLQEGGKQLRHRNKEIVCSWCPLSSNPLLETTSYGERSGGQLASPDPVVSHSQQVLSSILIRSEFQAAERKKPPRCARRKAWPSWAWARVRGVSLPG